MKHCVVTVSQSTISFRFVSFRFAKYYKLANRKHEQLSYPKNPKMCDRILVTLLKMRPHYCPSSRENATPSGGTSPLASYTEVTAQRPPPPRPGRPKTIISFEYIILL